MTAGRIVGCVGALLTGGCVWALLAATGTVGGQSYPLTETVPADACFQYQLDMKLSGELRIVKEDQPATLKLSASATHVFPERILLAGESSGMPRKAARLYETARAVFQVGSERSERTLRPACSLMVVQRPKDQNLLYSPKSHLTREELDLTAGHFDTLAMTGLLPAKAVTLHDSWKVATDVVQLLCHLEGVTKQDLSCKLEEVKENVARVSVKGEVEGIDLGALVKMSVEASYHFDLGQKRLVALEWKQKDDRGQGPASPASVVETVYTVKRTPLELPDSLNDVALIAVPAEFEAPATLAQLAYHDPKSRYDMLYAREWQIVGQTPDHLVLRLLERGDFVAQATITPWAKAQPGQHLEGAEFQNAMADTPGWKQEQVLQTGEVKQVEAGHWAYRVSALGQMDGLKLLQNFYLLAGPGGDQVVLAFTMTQEQAEKLNTRDLSLVGSIELPTTATSAKPK